jgi:hypothetical protein
MPKLRLKVLSNMGTSHSHVSPFLVSTECYFTYLATLGFNLYFLDYFFFSKRENNNKIFEDELILEGFSSQK